jgi:hypothetical protein
VIFTSDAFPSFDDVPGVKTVSISD